MYYRRNTGDDFLKYLATPASRAVVPSALALGTERLTGIERNGFEEPIKWSGEGRPRFEAAIPDERSENEIAFDHLVDLKMSATHVAMHLDQAWRAGLFRQLDQLLDPEEWDFADVMPTIPSFKTFLRLITHNKPARRPGLGATANGHLVAAWANEQNRLTIECLPDDTVRWSVVQYDQRQRRISNAGTCPVDKLKTLLAPYQPEMWFGQAHNAS